MRKLKSTLKDPRYYQIAVLSCLLIYGWLALDLEIGTETALTIGVTALASQFLFTKLFDLPRFDPKSCLISALSLCLLLRTNFMVLAVAATVITIGSKFVLRIDDRHVFNPTNLGLVIMLVLSGQIWVSPGQWGSGAFFGFLMASIGGLVLYRAARSDVTYAFLVFYSGLLFGRAVWLGDPMSIPLHQIQNGAFLLFAFFMLSDPKTTPDSRLGRVVFAFLVAVGGIYVQFFLFRPHGLLYSLVLFAMTTPLINRLLPGRRYAWHGTALTSRPASERSFA